jgi:hypothetical protein
MIVLHHRSRTARLIPSADFHISYAKGILAPGYDRFAGVCDCGHADRASPARLAPAASSVMLIFWREMNRTNMQIGAPFRLAAKFALLPSHGAAKSDTVHPARPSDFVDSVTDGTRPGMTAIVVEADEGSTRAVDDIVAVGNGTVYRQAA